MVQGWINGDIGMYDFEVIEEVAKDLKLITSANGFNNTLKNVDTWFQPLTTQEQFPTAYVWALDDNVNMQTTDHSQQFRDLDIYIALQIQASTTKKDIQQACSKWKEDVMNWAARVKGNDKCLFTALVTNDQVYLATKPSLSQVAVYSAYVSAVSPAYLFDKARAEIVFLIKIQYTTN